MSLDLKAGNQSSGDLIARTRRSRRTPSWLVLVVALIFALSAGSVSCKKKSEPAPADQEKEQPKSEPAKADLTSSPKPAEAPAPAAPPAAPVVTPPVAPPAPAPSPEASAPAKPREEGRYYNEKHKFSIVFPADWTLQDSEMMVMALSPQENPADAFMENIGILSMDLGTELSAKDIADMALEMIKQMTTGLEVHEKGTKTIDGLPATYYVFSGKMGEIEVKTMQFVFMKGSVEYVITCTANPQTFEKYRPAFDNMISSFRFE